MTTDRCIICEDWFDIKDMETDGAERYCRTCWEEYLPEIMKGK